MDGYDILSLWEGGGEVESLDLTALHTPAEPPSGGGTDPLANFLAPLFFFLFSFFFSPDNGFLCIVLSGEQEHFHAGTKKPTFVLQVCDEGVFGFLLYTFLCFLV